MMEPAVYESEKAIVRIHWGKYIRDGKVTEEGAPVISEAMTKFYRDILREDPNYFKKEKKQ